MAEAAYRLHVLSAASRGGEKAAAEALRLALINGRFLEPRDDTPYVSAYRAIS